MRMTYDEIMQRFDPHSEIVALAIVLTGLLLILLLNRKRLFVGLREWRIQRSLKKIGAEQIRHLICPDGLDGHYTIDRLALVQDAILLIAYKPYSGNIYCAERIAEWTQVVGQKSFKFENPLFELENQLASIHLLIGAAPLRGYLFFNHSAEFPKGHPDNVLHPGNIPATMLSENCAAPTAESQAAWDLLKALKQGKPQADEIGLKT